MNGGARDAGRRDDELGLTTKQRAVPVRESEDACFCSGCSGKLEEQAHEAGSQGLVSADPTDRLAALNTVSET